MCAERFRSALLWSYPASVTLSPYHAFAMFDLSVCGVNLQQGVLQSVEPISAIVDTGSSCLGLPLELFDAVVSWLPVTCSDSADGTQTGASTAAALPALFGGNVYEPVTESGVGALPAGSTANPASAGNINPAVRYCWLAADLLVDVLPTLSFRLSASDPSLADSDPSQQPRLVLPLADLLLGTPRATFAAQSVPQRLCLYRSPSLFSEAVAVSLGGRALQALHAVFSMESHQVAFAQQPGVAASNATCVRPVHCVGQQSHDATYNLCVDPQCSSFYLFSLNTDSHQCELTAAFHVLAALAIALFVAVELGLNEWMIAISKRVQGIGDSDGAQQQQRAAAAAGTQRRRSHRR